VSEVGVLTRACHTAAKKNEVNRLATVGEIGQAPKWPAIRGWVEKSSARRAGPGRSTEPGLGETPSIEGVLGSRN